MKLNIVKKIISFSFLILFLISLFIPYTSHAEIAIQNTSKTITSNSITFNGNVVVTPGSTIPTLYFYYAKTQGISYSTLQKTKSTITISGAPLFSFTKKITGLQANTNYKILITNMSSLGPPNAQTIEASWDFKTLVTGAGSSSGEAPQTVITNEATNIYPIAATLSGNITNSNMSAKVGFKYGTNESNLNNITIKETQSTDGKFQREITALTRGTTYYFKACAENTYGETCGDIKSFTTKDPTQTTTITTTGISNEKTKLDYYPLAPLPGVGEENCAKDVNDRTICVKTDPASGGFAKYLNMIIQIIIGIVAVLSMIMIVMGGIEYMTSELVSSKQAGKDRILNAILGLILALGSYAILNTLNPDLLDVSLSNVGEVTIVDKGNDLPQTAKDGKFCTNTAGANGGYQDGTDWATIAGAKAILPAGSSVYNKECQKVGEKNCTSTFGLNTGYLTTILSKCPNCKPLTITGGTECWLHGYTNQNTSHRPSSSTIDLNPTGTLNKYITNGKTLKDWTRYKIDGISYLKEPNHWHVGP